MTMRPLLGEPLVAEAAEDGADQRREEDDGDHRGSALHHVDVLDRDRPGVAEEADEDGEPDRRLGGGDRQHEEREDLPDQVAEIGREGDEVDVHRQQHQLDRHQDDDDVLAVDEDAHDPGDEQDRRHRQVVRRVRSLAAHAPCPGLMSTRCTAAFGSRYICFSTSCRFTCLPLAERQHDRPDHRHQQDQPRRLEQEDVLGVDQLAERRGVVDRRPAPA